MASEKVLAFVENVKELTVLELAELVKALEEEFGVAMNEELEREVLVMCNLSQGVKAEGREEGINIGEMRMLVQLVRDGDLKIERAAEKAKMTVEQFKKMMENTPLGRSL